MLLRLPLQPPTQPRKIRLRTTLLVPFMLQLVAAVGLVGWLSWRSGQQAVNDMASQLRLELAVRVHQEVDRYLETPHRLHQLNAQFLRENPSLRQTPAALERHFWEQSRLFNQLGTLAFANDRGEFIGANGLETYVVAATQATGSTLRRFAVDAQGQRGRLLQQRANYDARKRAWYKTAVASGRFVWTDIEPSAIGQRLDVSAVAPLYGPNRELQGVLLCDLPLSGISRFLQQLKIGKSGQVFILERNGWLVAHSTQELTFVPGKGEGKPVRLPAAQSQNPRLRGTVAALNDRFGTLGLIRQAEQLDFEVNGQRQFLQVLPFQDGQGIDWLIAVVVPEADFMDRIMANANRTFWLCAAALVTSVVCGVLTARWIGEPIDKMTRASVAIAAGDLKQSITLDNRIYIEEVEKLAQSFNSMAGQLQQSFQRLESQKDAFARFFPPEYLHFLNREDVQQIELGDHVSKDMAVLFSDIRSFTSLVEQMTPQESFDFVNVYLQRVTPEVRRYNGTVVKFLGDGVMAVFPDAAEDAMRSAIAQIERIRELNQERQAAGQEAIAVGMGIHVGHVMVGMVGEYNRMQGDALSDTINLTARLEGLTKFYGVSLLVSGDFLDRLSDRDRYQLRFLDRAIVKGRTEPISIYEVLDAEPEKVRSLKQQTGPDFAQGRDCYGRGDLAAAWAYFEAVLAANPVDRTARLYLDRLQQLLEKGLPEPWEGVWAFAEK